MNYAAHHCRAVRALRRETGAPADYDSSNGANFKAAVDAGDATKSKYDLLIFGAAAVGAIWLFSRRNH
jgi:hypothetical protein